MQTLKIDRTAMLVDILNNGSGHQAAWRSLLPDLAAYPDGKRIPAFAAPRWEDQPKRFCVATLTVRGDAVIGPVDPVSLELTDGEHRTTARLDGGDGAAQAAELLFHRDHRSMPIAFWRGARFAFHILLRHFARAWAEMGLIIKPLAAGSDLKAIIVSRGRHNWYLTDIPTVTGIKGMDWEEFAATFVRFKPAGTDPIRVLWAALAGFQKMTVDLLGVNLRLTAPVAALRAATRSLGLADWKQRPSPLSVLLARQGGGFRGGYAYARRYVGMAYKADMNKAYAWALSQELPKRSSIGHGIGPGGVERAGMFMATITGPGAMPVYIPVWDPARGRMEIGYWNADEAITVLPTDELPGLRALGFSVDLGIGLVTQETFTLAPFVEKLQGLIGDNPRGSAEVAIAKAFAVAVYGKFAEKPQRQDIAYAWETPGEGWFPFLDERGEEYDGLWTRRTITYNAHQHIDVAAAITGVVRSRLYVAMATALHRGGTIVHADTDGFLSTAELGALGVADSATIGDWRVSGEPEHTAVSGRKAHAFGADARVGGVTGATAAMVELAAYGETVVLAGQKLAPPWKEGPMFQPLSRSFGATA